MNIAPRVALILKSPKFFYGIIVLFVVQASWIALTGRYPMAFDEDFHLGVIRLYADHLLPFWGAHPAGGDAFGAVTRDPSYLYHYLMALPYHLISFFTDNQAIQVLFLRALNIAMFAAGLPLYRKLLIKTGAPVSFVHTSLLFYVIIPIVPLLGAQINYDNAIMPLTALTLLLALKLNESLRKNAFDITSLLQLLLVGCMSSLIKYAYLPIFIGVVAFLLVRGYQVYGSPVRLLRVGLLSWRKLQNGPRFGLLALLVVASLLVGERYVGNLVRYHTPVPDCAQVLDYDHCKAYGPWIRDYNFAQTKSPDADKNPIHYTQDWIHGMWYRTYFAVDGPTTHFQTRGPLVLPGLGGIIGASVGGLAFVLMARRLWRRYNGSALTLFSIVSLIYVAILWLTEYQLFVQTSVPVAINGRYLLPVLPLAIIATTLAVRELLGRYETLQLAIAGAVLICALWGGGAMTYILRSNDAWYWQGTPLKSANHALQQVFEPVTPGYSTPGKFIF